MQCTFKNDNAGGNSNIVSSRVVGEGTGDAGTRKGLKVRHLNKMINAFHEKGLRLQSESWCGRRRERCVGERGGGGGGRGKGTVVVGDKAELIGRELLKGFWVARIKRVRATIACETKRLVHDNAIHKRMRKVRIGLATIREQTLVRICDHRQSRINIHHLPVVNIQ